ncbi:MAG: hypothetical protein ACRDOO_17135 [Actinomadura sp.]
MSIRGAASESLMPEAVATPEVGRPGGVVTAVMVVRHFPGAMVWQGRRTGSWWAVHPAVGRLVEADCPAGLAFALRAALMREQRADGRWAPRAAALSA